MKLDSISELADISQLEVLLIDDNLLVHETLTQTLNDMGIWSIKCAQNAFYGLKLCNEKSFHVIICAFNVKSDKDGFHLLEELKFKRHVTKSTLLIFLSAETDESLVNSIVELEPDDFWVKPLSVDSIKSRFFETLQIKKTLFNIYKAMDNRSFSKALYFADRHLLNNELAQYHPRILRMKGEALLGLLEFSEAEIFYQDLLNQFKHAWVYLGYVKSLLKQGRIDQIHGLICRLINKPETRFGAHDMLAQYYIERQDYQRAYEEIKQAARLAPRNIERNKKSWDLARLNHDHKGQYIATKNIASYAKNSIHDSPQLQLNVIRASIDLAGTMTDGSSEQLLQQTQAYIEQLENDDKVSRLFRPQILVVKARLHNVRGEKDKAEKIIENHIALQPSAMLEDDLDKVKVLHELGMREEAIALLDTIKQQISGDSLTSQVIHQYVEQEASEREEIYFTVKQLNVMAKQFIKKNRMNPALGAIQQALKLTPANKTLTMRLFKVLIGIKSNDDLSHEHYLLADNIIYQLGSAKLTDKAQVVFQDMKAQWYQQQ